MNPFLSIYKKIGIILGLLVLGSVGGVTIVKEKKATVTPQPLAAAVVVDTTTTTKAIQSSAQATTKKVTAVVTTPKVASVRTRSSEEENEGGGDDDGRSYTSVAKTPTPTQTPAPVATTATPPPATTPKNYTSVYKDGTYTAIGSYMSPGGPDQISITLTLKNDIITAVSATSMAGDGTSQYYQQQFISGYKQYVVGQNIANVSLTNVSGSSLTPIGFNDAISQIMSQAKA